MAAHLGTRSAAAAFATGGAAARASRPRQAAAAQCQPRHSPAGAPRQPRRLLSPAHSGAGRAGCSRRGGVACASARDASQASAAIASAEPSGAQLLRDSRGDFVMTQPITVDKLVALLVLGVPWRSVAAWFVTACVAYTLSDFMGLAGATFILSFLGNSVINLGSTRWPNRRRLLTFTWFALIILGVVGFGLVTIPSITREGADLVTRIQAENPYVLLGEKLRAALGDALSGKLERFLTLLTVSSSTLTEGPAATAEVLAHLAAEVEESAVGAWGAERSAHFGAVLQSALKQHTSAAVYAISAGLARTSRFTVQGLVSLVLSFVIVWDMPAVRLGAQSLRASRLGWIYAEVAPALASFGALFGKALQAQLLVACVNTALTAAGMVFLELPGVAFLTAIVFFCSFIPVAGVLISTAPIGFVALTEYGVGRLFAVVVLVVVAHAIEAYLVNPAIYAAHLKLHPLIVLVVLVLAEHSLGVWGLLLAVPATVFFMEYVIKSREQREEEARLEAEALGARKKLAAARKEA